MSDIFEINSGTGKNAQPVCRVSYTLNNAQPVSSTIIGDQPLFYMDYTAEFEEEDDNFFDSADFSILENELETLKKEIKNLDKFSESFLQPNDKCFQDFLSDKEIISKLFKKETNENRINEIKKILSQSRMATSYLECIKEHNVKIKMNAQIREAQYDRRAGIIFINPHIEKVDQILLTIRELRRHWQHRQGALINPLIFQPDNAVLINRVQTADLAVSMVRVAWELQLADIKYVWERIENSSMADLGRAIAREAFMDFRTLNNGQASAAVFETWFLSERCRIEDQTLIRQMLADYQGYVFDVDKAEKSITPDLICALGEMPYGKNYLSSHVGAIMDDPIFTDMRDRSNANFLWFIKFERSFRETEQELQTDVQETADGVRRRPLQDQNQDLNYGDEQTAQIIALSGNGQKSNKPISKSNADQSQSAEIVYLRRWSGE